MRVVEAGKRTRVEPLRSPGWDATGTVCGKGQGSALCRPPGGLLCCPPALPVPLPGLELHTRARACPRHQHQSPSSRTRSTLEIIVPKRLCCPSPSPLLSPPCQHPSPAVSLEDAGCHWDRLSPCSARRCLVQISFASQALSRFLLAPTTSRLLRACVACPSLCLWNK